MGNPEPRHTSKLILIHLPILTLSFIRNLIVRSVPDLPNVLCFLVCACLMITTTPLRSSSLEKTKTNYFKFFGNSARTYQPHHQETQLQTLKRRLDQQMLKIVQNITAFHFSDACSNFLAAERISCNTNSTQAIQPLIMLDYMVLFLILLDQTLLETLTHRKCARLS